MQAAETRRDVPSAHRPATWWRRRRAYQAPPIEVTTDGDIEPADVTRAKAAIDEVIERSRKPVTSAHVTLRRPAAGVPGHQQASAHAELAVPDRVIHASAEADEIGPAIVLLERRLRAVIGHRARRFDDRLRRRRHAR
jgi:hypothetical protein